MPLTLVRRCRIAAGRPGQRTVEVILGVFQKRFRGPEQTSRVQGRGDSRRSVAGQYARLQLADPIPAFRKLEIRIAGESTLSLHLIEPVIVERPKSAGESPKRSDQGATGAKGINDQAKERLVSEREPTLA